MPNDNIDWDEDPRDHDDPWVHPSPKTTPFGISDPATFTATRSKKFTGGYGIDPRGPSLTESQVRTIVAEEVTKAFQQIMDRLDELEANLS